jgi:hypothetical protein
LARKDLRGGAIARTGALVMTMFRQRDVEALAELPDLAHHLMVDPYVVVDHRPVDD